MGILSLLLWTPLIGAIILSAIPVQRISIIRNLANVIATLALLQALNLLAQFDAQNPAIQFAEHFTLNVELGNAYALGVDGLSLPMVLLGSLLMFVALQASMKIQSGIKAYYISMLLLQFGMLGVFLAQDWVLFYVFWEATLVPLFFLIDRWGGKRRHAASLNFVLYTIGGSLFLLVALFALGEFVADMGGAMMPTFSAAAQKMPQSEQILVLIAFLIGFGVKMPIFPLHGWLPLAHTEAPYPVSILLSGVLLKMGGYGLLRVAEMLPWALQTLQPVLVPLALFCMLYGGLLAWRQSDLKAMVAYSSISHMGVVFLGILTLNLTGMTGAVLQMSAHGLSAAALFLLLGFLYERTATLNIQEYSSLATVMPRFAVLMTLSLLGAMGLPGTAGFMAELLAIIGGFERWGGWVVFFSFSILIGAAYVMRTIGLLFTGPVKPQMLEIADLNNKEFALGILLVSLILLFGFIPNLSIGLSEQSVKQTLAAIAGRIGG